MQFAGEEPRAQVEPFQLDCVTFLKIATCIKWFSWNYPSTPKVYGQPQLFLDLYLHPWLKNPPPPKCRCRSRDLFYGLCHTLTLLPCNWLENSKLSWGEICEQLGTSTICNRKCQHIFLIRIKVYYIIFVIYECYHFNLID